MVWEHNLHLQPPTNQSQIIIEWKQKQYASYANVATKQVAFFSHTQPATTPQPCYREI